MNTVFDPAMLFISERDWSDDEKQANFTKHLVDHIELMNKHKITRIYWAEKIGELLWISPQLPPWREYNESRNGIIPIIYKRLEPLLEYLDCCEIIDDCRANISIKHDYGNENIFLLFMTLMHHIIHLKEEVFLCLGLQNASKTSSDNFIFSCCCHENTVTPKLINKPDDWLFHLNLARDFWPGPGKNPKDSSEKLKQAIEITRIIKYPEREALYVYEFTEHFIDDISKITNIKDRDSLLTSIVHRLILYQKNASNDNGLHDEQVKGTKTRRFRVSGVRRVHYTYPDKNKTLRFTNYYPEGHHDDGL